MKNKIIFLAGIIGCHLVVGTRVNAATLTPFCPPFSALGKELNICEDNFPLAQDAIRCLKKYTADIRAGQKRIAAILKSNNGKLKNKQNHTYDSAAVNYADVKKELDRMIANGVSARAAMDSYYAELYFPEDWDNPSILGMSSADYLNSEPCFAEPKKVILRMTGLVDKAMRNLSQTSAASFAKEGTSTQFSQNVKQNSKAATVLNSPSGAEAAQGAKGINAKGSTITETTRKKPSSATKP